VSFGLGQKPEDNSRARLHADSAQRQKNPCKINLEKIQLKLLTVPCPGATARYELIREVKSSESAGVRVGARAARGVGRMAESPILLLENPRCQIFEQLNRPLSAPPGAVILSFSDSEKRLENVRR